MHPTTITPFGRRSLALVLALAAPLGLLACSDDEPERATVESQAAADDEQPGNEISGGTGSEQTPDDEDDTPADDGGGAGSGSRDEVIGTSTGTHPADPGEASPVPLRLDVFSVRRDGEVAEVLFSITNTGTEHTFEPYSALGDPQYDGWDVGGAALIAGDTRYLTLYDSADTCLCTDDLQNLGIDPGETAQFSTQVSAPPEDVTEVTFTLPGFDPISGLELS